MAFDRNANSPLRHRRNAQHIGDGDLSTTIIAASPLVWDGTNLSITISSVGGIYDSSGLAIKLNGASLALSASGLNIADRDFGDISTGTNGTIWSIDNNVVTFAKMQDIAADTIIGRITGTGDPELITCTSFGRAILDDTSVAAQRTTLGLGTGDSPQFTALEIGAASDTTLSRASAGNLQVEGKFLYRVDGTDVAIADGGTGQSTATLGFNALAPSQTNNEGRVLVSNGTNASWTGAGGTNQFNFAFSTTTTGPPATGYLLVNAGVSTISINKTDHDGNSIGAFLLKLQDHAPWSVRGYFVIRSKLLSTRVLFASITTAATDNTSYYTWSITNVFYTTGFNADEVLSVEFITGPSPFDNDSLQLSSGILQLKKFRDVTSFLTSVPGEVVFHSTAKKAFLAQATDTSKTISGLIHVIDTNSTPIANAASGTFTSSYVFPANFFTQLQTLRVRMGFKYSVLAATTPTLTITPRIGGQNIFSVAKAPSATGVSDRRIVVDVILACRATGASGSFGRNGVLHWELSTTAGDTMTIPLATTAVINPVDTTATVTIDATAAWSATDPANTVTMTDLSIEVL